MLCATIVEHRCSDFYHTSITKFRSNVSLTFLNNPTETKAKMGFASRSGLVKNCYSGGCILWKELAKGKQKYTQRYLEFETKFMSFHNKTH